MEPLRDTAGNPLPVGPTPTIYWNTYLQVQLFFLLPCPEGVHGTPAGHCREPSASRGQPPSFPGKLISRFVCPSCFPALEAPMEPLQDTAGNPLPAGANPAIHWNTYLQVQLFFLLSCPGGAHGIPARHCREPPPSTGTLISRYGCSSCFPALEVPMEPLQDTAGNPLPAGANPRHPLEHLSPGTVVLLAFLPWRRPWNLCRTLQGTPCQPEPAPPSTGTLISRYSCSCFPALEAPMEPLQDTAGNPLPARANPAIHWNSYLQVQLFFLLSSPRGAHGAPEGHCREPFANGANPHHPLEHLSPGTVVLLAFLP